MAASIITLNLSAVPYHQLTAGLVCSNVPRPGSDSEGKLVGRADLRPGLPLGAGGPGRALASLVTVLHTTRVPELPEALIPSYLQVFLISAHFLCHLGGRWWLAQLALADTGVCSSAEPAIPLGQSHDLTR